MLLSSCFNVLVLFFNDMTSFIVESLLPRIRVCCNTNVTAYVIMMQILKKLHLITLHASHKKQKIFHLQINWKN